MVKLNSTLEEMKLSDIVRNDNSKLKDKSTKVLCNKVFSLEKFIRRRASPVYTSIKIFYARSKLFTRMNETIMLYKKQTRYIKEYNDRLNVIKKELEKFNDEVVKESINKINENTVRLNTIIKNTNKYMKLINMQNKLENEQ